MWLQEGNDKFNVIPKRFIESPTEVQIGEVHQSNAFDWCIKSV
jgi:hypothetical protein